MWIKVYASVEAGMKKENKFADKWMNEYYDWMLVGGNKRSLKAVVGEHWPTIQWGGKNHYYSWIEEDDIALLFLNRLVAYKFSN